MDFQKLTTRVYNNTLVLIFAGALAALSFDNTAVRLAQVFGVRLVNWQYSVFSLGFTFIFSTLIGLRVAHGRIRAAFATALVYGYLVIFIISPVFSLAVSKDVFVVIGALIGPVIPAIIVGVPAGFLARSLARRWPKRFNDNIIHLK